MPPRSNASCKRRVQLESSLETLERQSAGRRRKPAGRLAKQQLNQANAQAAALSQVETERFLRTADEQIQEALRQLASRQANELTRKSVQASQLASQARRVDPGAAAALSQAQQAA